MASINHASVGGIDESEIPLSLLDTDLYKLTMQNAVLHCYPDAMAEYKFTNRAVDMVFSRTCFEWIQTRLNALANVRLHESEREYLANKVDFFPPVYVDFLAQLQLRPQEQVRMSFEPTGRKALPGTGRDEEDIGNISIAVVGPWKETILYEVPIMYIMCEGYFKVDEVDWKDDHEEIFDKAKRKALRLLSAAGDSSPSQPPLLFSEFGTRRRRSYKIQETVLQGLIEGDREWRREQEAAGRAIPSGGLAGTSNVYLAMKYGLKPIGTIAHEWIMAIGAKEGYKGVNAQAMAKWEHVYPPSPTSPLHTMLTDTFTAGVFFAEYTADRDLALRWNGLRHDSGDPIEFAVQAREAWVKVGAELQDDGKIKGRRLIFSDGLDVDEALRIGRECERIGIGSSYGIGTHLTNDFQRTSDPSKSSKPLNIVVKIHRIDGLECVKLTDDKGKFTGDKEVVQRVMRELGVHGEATKSRG